jgi:hypothetical protein
MSDRTWKIVRQLTGWRALKVLIYLTFGMVTGCFGPQTMHHDIQEYNKEALSSEKEMLLFNIGELHDNLPPHFMMLSSIAQTRSFSAGGSFQWSQALDALAPTTAIANMVNNAIGSRTTTTTTSAKEVGSTWEAGPFTAATAESPTFQFVPLQGQDFATRFESSLTDKLTLFLEDREQYATDAEKEAIVLLFAQSLALSHGDHDKCKPGFYVNRNRYPQDQNPETHYYNDFSACVKEIVESADYYNVVDSGYPVPTKASDEPKSSDVVTALQQNLEWTKNGDTFKLIKPFRIPAWFDYDPEFVAPPEKPDPSPLPVFWIADKDDVDWEAQQYMLPKGYQWKVYKFNKNYDKSDNVYALVPDGYELARDDQTGNLKLDENGNYVLKKSGKLGPHLAYGTVTSGSQTITNIAKFVITDLGRSITGKGIPPGTTIVWLDAAANTAMMSVNATDSSGDIISVGDADQFSYGDKVVSDIWPSPQNYFYVELRKGEVGDATAKEACHGKPYKYDYNNDMVCGYFKIGNLLQVMQRLADAACDSKDPQLIENSCPESIFGIGPIVPSWADSRASYTGTEGKEWIWVPAHDPETNRDAAERDRTAFFTLYKLFQTSLVNTSSLVSGSIPITIGK